MWIAPLAAILKASAVAALFVAGYLALASHHYGKGWDAHALEVREQTEALNRQIGELNTQLAISRAVAQQERERALREILDSLPPALPPEPAPDPAPPSVVAASAPRPAPSCSLPRELLDKLNRIR